MADLGKGFDNELGVTYVELGPDGGTARLTIDDRLLQPWGIVHGGVYCSIIESLASVSAQLWLAENGGGNVVGVNNNTDFLRAISPGTVTAVSAPSTAGGANSSGRSPSPTSATVSWPAARCGCRTCPPSNTHTARAAASGASWQYRRLCA